MGGHPKWQRILDPGGDPGGKGSPAVGAAGSREDGGGSEKEGSGLHRVTAGTKDREATPKTFGGGHGECGSQDSDLSHLPVLTVASM